MKWTLSTCPKLLTFVLDFHNLTGSSGQMLLRRKLEYKYVDLVRQRWWQANKGLCYYCVTCCTPARCWTLNSPLTTCFRVHLCIEGLCALHNALSPSVCVQHFQLWLVILTSFPASLASRSRWVGDPDSCATLYYILCYIVLHIVLHSVGDPDYCFTCCTSQLTTHHLSL